MNETGFGVPADDAPDAGAGPMADWLRDPPPPGWPPTAGPGWSPPPHSRPAGPSGPWAPTPDVFAPHMPASGVSAAFGMARGQDVSHGTLRRTGWLAVAPWAVIGVLFALLFSSGRSVPAVSAPAASEQVATAPTDATGASCLTPQP